MADLTGTTPAATYKGLLQVNDYTDGVDATAKYIQDGEGTDSALAISTDKVGIGTASPNQKLDVAGNVAASSIGLNTDTGFSAAFTRTDKQPAIKFKGINSSTGLNYSLGIEAIDSNNNKFSIKRIDDADGFKENLLTIKSDGKVGIGTNSPITLLHIEDDDANTSITASNPRTITIQDTSEVNNALSLLNFTTSNNYASAQIGTRATTNIAGAGVRSEIIFSTRNSDNTFTEKMVIKPGGNVGIGTTNFGTNASGVIGIGNATAPTSSPADMVQLYAEDVTASSELRVRDEAGNVTTLSPHAKDAPDSLYDNGKGVDEMHRVANHYLGVITFTNVDRRNDLMQKQLNGEELPEDRTFKVTETFAEYNARTGADLQVEDWDANQQAMFDAQEEMVVARQAEIDAWDNEEEAPEPLQSYVKKPKPDWLS